jgi:hypothetical protein
LIIGAFDGEHLAGNQKDGMCGRRAMLFRSTNEMPDPVTVRVFMT